MKTAAIPQTTTIESISHDGRGISHINGKTIFIENALPNEKVNFIYTKRHNNYDEGKALTIIEQSCERATPKCPHFGECGGCSLQHLTHNLQIKLKQQTLLEQLKHFGNVIPQNLLPPITGPIWHYRNKARLSVKYVQKKNKVLVGFHEKNGRYIAEIETCVILQQSVGEKIKELSNLISNLSIFASIPQIEVAVTQATTALVFRHLKEFNSADLELLQKFAIDHHFKIYLQPQKVESIHTLNIASQYLSYKLPTQNIELFFHPTDFTQTNHALNQKLVTTAIELLSPKVNDEILDLFCGIGNFSLALASKCTKVIGIEGSEIMVKRAQANATHNKIENTEFYCADLTQELYHSWTTQKFHKIILDPPRTGALEIIKSIAKFNAVKILYVSCNPATLARDTKELIAQNYTLTHAGIIDMFPHTKHAEAIALFIPSQRSVVRELFPTNTLT